MMNENDVRFLEESFKRYYFNNIKDIHVQKEPRQREFGYQKFNSGMIRHLSLKDDKELHILLVTKSPADVYCSNAYYLFPNLPMNEKEWQRADLIFDIDAKDLNLECRDDHILHKCNDCSNIFQKKKASCDICNSKKLDTRSVTCSRCITGAKTQVKKLVEILTGDFGISEKNIQIYFSGNEGFHIHVYNTKFEKSRSQQRVEIVDYITLNGAYPDAFGISKSNPNNNISFPELGEDAWSGRFAKEIFRNKTRRSKIINQIKKEGYASFQKRLFPYTHSLGIKIDPNVTIDIHRIFRLPGSLNSKSGLCKLICKDLDTFDPYSEACLLDDSPAEILVTCPTQFKLNNKKFGPYKNEKVTVPTFAAAYMICKGLATVTNN